MDIAHAGQEVDPLLIKKARNDLTFRSQVPAIVGVVFLTLALCWSIQDSVPLSSMVIWSGVCVFSYVLRYVLCHFYHAADEDKQKAFPWAVWFGISSAVSGLIWGSATYFIFPLDSLNHQLLILMVLVILSAGTSVTHSAFSWASIGFTLCCMVPAAVRLFFLEDSSYSTFAIFILIFSLVMVSSSFYLAKMANRMFLLSYENSVLIESLRDSNTDLQNKNAQLEDAKEALSHANDNLQKLATTDVLTGLTNRRKFEALVKVKWQRCAEEGAPISVVLLNIDMFRHYNEFYGARRGDSCLARIGEFLTLAPEINRKSDCIARYGGDEFAILLVNVDSAGARRVAESLRRGVEHLRISRSEMPNELSPWISVSVGYANESSFNDEGHEELLERAVRSLHNAKRSGRNQVDPGTNGRAIA